MRQPRRLPLLALTASVLALAAAQPATAAGGPRDRGTLSTACPTGDVAPSRFTDIGGSVHAASIACLRWYEIGRGTSDDMFGERGGVTRAQAATFLARLLVKSGVALPADAPDAFTDDDSSPHEGAINALAALGVVTGQDGRYAPDQVVGRAQMASVLVRAAELVRDARLADDGDHFSDDEGSVHTEAIDKLATAGIVAGRGPRVFDPAGRVTRGQMASFLMRLVDLLVDEGELRRPASLDWPRGEWLPGDVLPVTVRGEGIASVSLSGCGLTEVEVTDLDEATAGIQFAVTVPESLPVDEDGDVEDECELEVRVLFTDGRTQVLEREIELRDGDDSSEPDEDEDRDESDEDERDDDEPDDDEPDDEPDDDHDDDHDGDGGDVRGSQGHGSHG